MPIYEYRCNCCKREFTYFFIGRRKTGGLSCKFCKSRKVTRLLSTFQVHQTEESRVANFDTSKARTDSFYKDSRNVGLWTKKRMKEMGVDLGSKLDEIVEKGRTGRILDAYEK